MSTVVKCTNPQAWNDYVHDHGKQIYYRWEWRELCEEVFGHEHEYLTVIDDQENIVGAVPLVKFNSSLFGKFAVSLPFVTSGGMLANCDRARDLLITALEEYASKENLSQLTLREFSSRAINWSCQEHKVRMLLDLPRESDELWQAIGSKRRAQVKRPGKEGAYTSVGGTDLLDDFYSVYSRNMRDLGTPVQSKRFFLRILEVFPSETHIVTTYLHDKPVAAAFLIRHGDEMEIPWASSLREANRFGVNMLLYWEVLKHSISIGATRFDFGRSSKDSNTLRFKRQWGAEPEQLYWYSWTREGSGVSTPSTESGKFATAISIWQRLPVAVANLMGPHIVKYLP